MITSLSNERIKRVRALQSQRRARETVGLFVIEGLKLAHEAVIAAVPIDEVFYVRPIAEDEQGRAILDGLSKQGAALLEVDEAVMRSISDTQTPQGIVLVLPVPHLAPPDSPSFVLVIDAISDPGNMGAIMRVCAAAGVPVLYTTKGTVDLTNPKVVRSGMGAHFRLPVQPLSWEGVASRLQDRAIFLAESAGGAPYFRVDWTQPCALIVSDEAHGPGEEAVRLATTSFRTARSRAWGMGER